MTDLGDNPAKNGLSPEKRPDLPRFEKGNPPGGQDAAEGRDGIRATTRGSAEHDQEETEEEKTGDQGGTARPRRQTEKESEQEGEGQKGNTAHSPERMTHAAEIAIPVPE